MKTYILVALGCVFWAVPLSFLVMAGPMQGTPENWYGFPYEGRFSYDALVLFAIPLLMLAWTMFLGWLAKRDNLTETMVSNSSVLAIFVSFTWCGLLVLLA